MKNRFPLLFILLVQFSLVPFSAHAETHLWNLPLVVNDQNTTVNFEVDTTWHMVHGKTAGLTGEISLASAKDPNSIQATVHIPVKNFDTDDSSRDETLREAMAEPTFPEVVFKVTRAEGLCSPESLKQQPECSGLLVGSLKIRDIEREIKVPVTVKLESNKYRVEGMISFPWAAFGVEDPSIFIARVDPDVAVKFSVLL